MLVRYAIYSNMSSQFFSGFFNQEGSALNQMRIAEFSDENVWLASTYEQAVSVIADILKSTELLSKNNGNLVVVLHIELDISE